MTGLNEKRLSLLSSVLAVASLAGAEGAVPVPSGASSSPGDAANSTASPDALSSYASSTQHCYVNAIDSHGAHVDDLDAALLEQSHLGVGAGVGDDRLQQRVHVEVVCGVSAHRAAPTNTAG